MISTFPVLKLNVSYVYNSINWKRLLCYSSVSPPHSEVYTGKIYCTSQMFGYIKCVQMFDWYCSYLALYLIIIICCYYGLTLSFFGV